MNVYTKHKIKSGHKLYLRQWKAAFKSTDLIVRLKPSYANPPEFALRPDIETWCETNCKAAWGIEYNVNAVPNRDGRHGITNFNVVFEDPNEQFAFKMRWL